MGEAWINRDDELPRRGQDIWCYDAMFGGVIAWTVTCEPAKMDGDISHWMPRVGMLNKPTRPTDGKVHAKGFPKDE